ncbi:hypothetical protein CDIK_0472 [Cucumispora dikerogammari]|nr:hypothetical protein CDIK_0472 [Cucumispora dikerogammari]
MSTTTAVIASQILFANGKPITTENIKELVSSFGGKYEEEEIKVVVEKIGTSSLSEIQSKGQSMMGSIASSSPGSVATGAVEEVKEAVKEESEEVDVDMDDFF